MLQTEVAAFLKPCQISIYMSLLHQQFCFFSGDAELCWKKPHSKTSAYRKLQFAAPKAVYLLKTGTKLNNKLNLSTSSWLGLNKQLFLRQQKTHFIYFFFKNISLEIWRWFFFPASFSFAVIAIKDAIQFKWLQLTPNSGGKKGNYPSFLNQTADKQRKARFYWTLSSLIWSTARIIHTAELGHRP